MFYIKTPVWIEVWAVASHSYVSVWAQCAGSVQSLGQILVLALPWVCYQTVVCLLTLGVTF